MAFTCRGFSVAASPDGPRLRAMSLKCQERITRWIASMRRKENFLAIDAVCHDRIKTRPRCKPVVPSLGLLEFQVGPFGWIDQDAAVEIEHYRIALGQNFEVLPVLKVCPCGSICQGICVDGGCKIEGCADAFARIAIPSLAGRLDTRRLPEPMLHNIGASAFASAYKWGAVCGNQRECREFIPQSANARRIGAWPDDDEIVVHYVAAINAVAICHKIVLTHPVMDEQRIDVTSCCYR